jgi:hypothetical protein
MRSQLAAIVAAELAAPVPPAVAAVAAAARARHGASVNAVLFYGSCLRDGFHPGLMIDLYLLVDGYRGLPGSPLMRALNWLIPPNVHYIETEVDGERIRAKYAMVNLPQFERLVGPDTLNPYFWARFAQPAGLVWARDTATAARVQGALVQAIVTTEAATRPLVGPAADPEALWARALGESYRTELRSERPDRARSIVAHDRARYRRIGAALAAGEGMAAGGTAAAAMRRWRLRRIQGKALSVLRLVKASFTFAGGADYLAWKIGRHAGVPVAFRPWERRHPLLAAPFVLWRLARRGIVR